MKFLITGDLHLRASNPENRIDNFFETQLSKVEQIFQIATKNRFDLLSFFVNSFIKKKIEYS